MTDSQPDPRKPSAGLKFKGCPPLLRLPREVRDLIYAHLLTSEIEPPEEDSIEVDKASTIEENQGHGSIYYERAPPTFACQDLLATYCQLHGETVEAIEHYNRVPGAALKHKLDLIVWARNLRPTWLWLPGPLRYVKRVVFDMKSLDYSSSHPANIPLLHPHTLAQYLLRMLRRFFQNGTADDKTRSKSQER
ncbi:MAG: hypothetical protein Q9188_003842 [Gyalolechia gomerana]